MSSLMEVYDSLPYVDPEISQAERDRAAALIERSLPLNHARSLHPSLTAQPESTFSERLTKEMERLASGTPRTGGVDMSRYEAPEEPSSNSDIDAWKSALRSAYASNTYLTGRQINLALLDEFGKNAWLIGNSQLESMMQNLEASLSDVKSLTEEVNRARKREQEGSRGELLGLNETWRQGIGKIIEVQVATNKLKGELSQGPNST